MALNVRYLKLIFLIQIISVPHLLHFGKSMMQSCLLFVLIKIMSHNLRQNGRKVQTLSPFHNIKGGKMAHLDFCEASSMAGMAVSCSILFNPRLCFGQNTCI